jgi:excisionase family DNA binding protein
MNEQRLLTVREVAERLRSSPETVRRWLRQGKLRGFRPGGTKLGYRVPESELQRFLRVAGEGKVPPPDGNGGSA